MLRHFAPHIGGTGGHAHRGDSPILTTIFGLPICRCLFFTKISILRKDTYRSTVFLPDKQKKINYFLGGYGGWQINLRDA